MYALNKNYYINDFLPSIYILAEQLESYLALKTGKLTSISPQHITSCAPNPLKCGGTGGCYGSLTEIGFTYAQLMGVLR